MFSDDQLLHGEFDSAAYLRYILHVTSGVDTGAEQKRLETLIHQIDDNIKHTLCGTEQRKRVTAYLVDEVRAIHECGSVMTHLSSNVTSLQRTSQRLESFVVEPYNRIRQTINQIENAQHALKIIKVVNRYVTCARQVERLVGTLDTMKQTTNSKKRIIGEKENSLIYKQSSTASSSAAALQTALRMARLLHEMKEITLSCDNNSSKNIDMDITKVNVVESLTSLYSTAIARITQIAQQTLSVQELLECNKEREENLEEQSSHTLHATETELTTTKAKLTKWSSNLLSSDSIAMVSMTLNDVTLALQSLHYIGQLPSNFHTALQRHVRRVEQYINEQVSLERFLHLLQLSQEERQLTENKNNTISSSNNKEIRKIDLIERAISKVLRYVQQQTQIVMLLWQGLLENSNNDMLFDFVDGMSNNIENNAQESDLFKSSDSSKLHNAQNTNNSSIDKKSSSCGKVKQLLQIYWEGVLLLLVQKLQTVTTNERMNRELAANYPRLREMFANFFFLSSSSTSSSSPYKNRLTMSLQNGQALSKADYYSSSSFLLSQNNVALSALTLQHCTFSNYALLMTYILQLCETTQHNDHSNKNNKEEEEELYEEYVKQIHAFYTSIVNPIEQHYAAINLSRHRQQVNKVLARLAMLTPASALLAQQMVHITSLHRLTSLYDNNNDDSESKINQLVNLSTPTESNSLNASQYTKTFVHETYYARHDLHTLSLVTENVVICLSQLSSKLYEVYKYCTSKLITNHSNNNNAMETIITSSSEFVSLIEKTSADSINSLSRISLLFFNLVNACVQVINDIDHVLHILPSEIKDSNCEDGDYNNINEKMKEWQLLTKAKIEESDRDVLLQRRSQLDQLRSSFVKLSKTQILQPLFTFAQTYFTTLIKNSCTINITSTHMITNGSDNVNTTKSLSNTTSLEHALFIFVARLCVYITPLCNDWTDYMRVLAESMFEEFIQSLLAMTTHSAINSDSVKEHVDKNSNRKSNVLINYTAWLHNMKAIANTLNDFAHATESIGLQRSLILLNGLSRTVVNIFEVIANNTHVQKMEESPEQSQKNDSTTNGALTEEENNIDNNSTANDVKESIEASKNVESQQTQDTTKMTFTSAQHDVYVKTIQEQKQQLSAALQYLSDMKVIVRLKLMFSLQFYVSTTHNTEQEHEPVEYNHFNSANKFANDTKGADTIQILSICAKKITEGCKMLQEDKLRPLIKQELEAFGRPHFYKLDTHNLNKNDVASSNITQVSNETLRKEYIAIIDKTLQEVFTLLFSDTNIDVSRQNITINGSQCKEQILSQLYNS